MKTREEAAAYGLTFPDSYEDRPFKDQRWQVIRVKPGKKIFLWIYEKDESIHLNVRRIRDGEISGVQRIHR